MNGSQHKIVYLRVSYKGRVPWDSTQFANNIEGNAKPKPSGFQVRTFLSLSSRN